MITLSHNQYLPVIDNGQWREEVLSGCPNGCKIYRLWLINDKRQWSPTEKYAYSHNSAYGCRR